MRQAWWYPIDIIVYQTIVWHTLKIVWRIKAVQRAWFKWVTREMQDR